MIAIDIAWIPLSRGMWAKADQADLVLLLGYVWHAIPQGKDKWRARGYLRGGSSKKRVYMHTLLTGSAYVDHRDRDPLNNTRANLNPDATHSENMRNTTSASNTGHLGVTWLESKKHYLVQLSIGPRNAAKRYAKTFRNLSDAVAYREALVQEHFKCRVS